MPPHVTAQTGALAGDIVATWQPNAKVTPMTPGAAGMAPYKVCTDSGDEFCLKVPIVVEDVNVMEGRKASLKREAALARWAGNRTPVAPPVSFQHAQTGAYAARFLPGRPPTSQEMARLRPQIFSALHALHGASTDDLPPAHPADDNWLLTRDVAADLGNAKQAGTTEVDRGAVDLLGFLEHTLSRSRAPQGVIHNDVHSGNLLVAPESSNADVYLIDMANARVADRMVDVAHYCHELYANDLEARPSNEALARDYDAAKPKTSPHRADPCLIALHLGRFDVRRQAFQRRWSPEEKMTDNLRLSCSSLTNVFTEHGYVPPRPFRR